MAKFKPGDLIRRKDGEPFRTGKLTAEVVEGTYSTLTNGTKVVWLISKGGAPAWCREDEVELASLSTPAAGWPPGRPNSKKGKVYIIGSLRNPEVPKLANDLRDRLQCEVFDDWYAAGEEGDDKWRDYEKQRGRSYIDAIREGYAAEHVFNYDKSHLDTSDAVVLCLPCGKSGHLEAGYCIGRGTPVYILLDDPERWDVMYKFANDVVTSVEELTTQLLEVL